jgi:indolepyruvate ferredoxin oxidoreductase beta subunit
MKYDIVLSGVGGQGVLSLSAIIAASAMREGLHVKQSEVHGMSQRGGSVQAHLRIADGPIASDLIPRGGADLILSMEPVESLRYVAWLKPGGSIVTAANAVVNIPDYPDLDTVLARVRALPNGVVVEAERLAEEAGDLQATNTVMVGAAASRLPMKPDTFERAVVETFRRKGERAVAINLAAFRSGQKAAT